MKTLAQRISVIALRTMMTLIMLTTPTVMMFAQKTNEKFAWTTKMFLNELKEKAKQPATAGPRRAPKHLIPLDRPQMKPHRLIASPDTVGGVAYISCFVHLKDVGDLSEVRACGVEIEETFDGLNFVTARVPVAQIEALAEIDNVTNIKVAECMRMMTDVARQKTNVDDLLTLSNDATALGINSKYDGSGVVLGIIDTGIDFHHIAFKDKDGNSRIKRAYVYSGSTRQEYTEITDSLPTTDDDTEDHGTHCASTAGGSSVIVDGSTVTVTDDHANATFGGMAPGADLYLAGVKGLNDTGLTNALKKMVSYADAQGKPLVVSNSWGSQWGPHNGTGQWATLVAKYFGDSHPNHVILFASSNDAGRSKDNEGGGFFVKKNDASASSPLGTIIRSAYYSNADCGYAYFNELLTAWAPQSLDCRIHVLDSSSGEVLKSWVVSSNTSTFDELSTYYGGKLTVEKGSYSGSNYIYVYSDDNGLKTQKDTLIQNYYKSAYTLAIEVYPTSGSANVGLWSGGRCYFTNHLNTSDHTWMAGTDDMCVSDEATIPDAISVGAYVSKNVVKNYKGDEYSSNRGELNDIAVFSSYATPEQSPTGLAYPWITAPGSQVVAGVNHYHTVSVDAYSYFNKEASLVVNNSDNPYGAMSGTSMATPVAAGIVALWLQAAKSVGKDLTVNHVKEIMEKTAIKDDYTNGANASHFGKGKIDALAGINYILTNETIGYRTLHLANNGNNAQNIAAAATNGGQYDVTLTDRTLFKDGDWNTLCLPFDVNLSETGCPLSGTGLKVMAFDAAASKFDNGTLTLSFTTVFDGDNNKGNLVAGTPYLIKWAKDTTSPTINSPVFNAVTIGNGLNPVTASDGSVTFTGTYDYKDFTSADNSILFLGSNNNLYYPLSDAKIGAQRAYFQLNKGITVDVNKARMYFDDVATGIVSHPSKAMDRRVSGNPLPSHLSGWYTLDGRRIESIPTVKGLYINNGKKVVIK